MAKLNRIAQFPMQYLEVVEAVGREDRTVKVDFETSAHAAKMRWKFYTFRKILLDDPQYKETSAWAEAIEVILVSGHSTNSEALGGAHLIFRTRDNNPEALALRAALDKGQ